jgi:hypothetical protein
MYNLIVSNIFVAGETLSFSLERGRFLEATDVAIQSQLKSLSKQAIEHIESWPCVVMNEGRANESAILAKIQVLTATQSEVSVRVTTIYGPVINELLWKARDALSIGQFEFNRNHWSIKARDLFAELKGLISGLTPDINQKFANKPLPIIPRSALMSAKGILTEWSHTDLDELLIEAGVVEVDPVGWTVGSGKLVMLGIL